MTIKTFFSKSLLFVMAFSIPMIFTNCGGDDDGAGDSANFSVITPGSGIGDATIGLSSSEVEDVLGAGDKDVINVIFFTIQTLTYADLGIIVVFDPIPGPDYDEDATVLGYNVFAPYDGATPEGISIGSTREDVIDAYGEPESIDADGLEEYPTLGINFEYDASMNVSVMAVY